MKKSIVLKLCEVILALAIVSLILAAPIAAQGPGYIGPAYQLAPPGPCWSCQWTQQYYTWGGPSLGQWYDQGWRTYSTSPSINGVWATMYRWNYTAAPVFGIGAIPGYVIQQQNDWLARNVWIGN